MTENNKKNMWCCPCGRGGSFWGWLFVIIGGYFLAQEFGWIPSTFPLWQLLLVAYGIYLITLKGK